MSQAEGPRLHSVGTRELSHLVPQGYLLLTPWLLTGATVS